MSAGRLGVFGGTFDPPHLGHLVVARDAAETLGLDRVLLVLAPRPPLRPGGPLTPADLRMEMLRAAVEGDSVLEASDVEMDRDGPSYTVDTLAALGGRHPGTELVLLIGADQWSRFDRWHDPRGIARRATVAVMARAGETPADLPIGVPWRPCPVTRIDVSATDVRARVAAGRSIRYLVPDAVRGIIERHQLYAETPPAPGGRSAPTPHHAQAR